MIFNRLFYAKKRKNCNYWSGYSRSMCITIPSKKGYSVTLFDRDEPGNAASYGNAGHFSPYASLQLNRTDILSDVPSMLLSSTRTSCAKMELYS